MTKERLIILANHLDAKGLTKEADYLDSIITRKIAQEDSSPMKDYLLEYMAENSIPADLITDDMLAKHPQLKDLKDPLETDEDDYNAGRLAALRNIQYFVGGLDYEVNKFKAAGMKDHVDGAERIKTMIMVYIGDQISKLI